MKTTVFFLWSLLLLTTFTSCKRDSDTINPTATDTTRTAPGAVTAIGNPTGTAGTAAIGPAGGTLESEDKSIRVDIPAGALSGTQTLSVQALDKNNCPGGTGQAFRLLPHGLAFAKPATITYHYDAAAVAGSHPALMQVAYQNEKHIWQAVSVKNIDTTAQTLAVQTTHFSDWALFKRLDLVPGYDVVNPGGSRKLSISLVYPSRNGELPLPLVNEQGELKKYVKDWTWSGGGTLVHAYDEGEYYAPATIPANNPVAITVLLNLPPIKDETGHTFTDLRLVSHIYVAPEGISYQIDGGAWQTFPGGANLQASQSVLLGSNGNDYISLTWPGNKTGRYRWVLGTNVAFNLSLGPKLYQHVYIENKKPQVSGGTLIVQHNDFRVLGTFTVTPSGWISPSTPYNSNGTANIRGVFNLRNVP